MLSCWQGTGLPILCVSYLTSCIISQLLLHPCEELIDLQRNCKLPTRPVNQVPVYMVYVHVYCIGTQHYLWFNQCRWSYRLRLFGTCVNWIITTLGLLMWNSTLSISSPWESRGISWRYLRNCLGHHGLWKQVLGAAYHSVLMHGFIASCCCLFQGLTDWNCSVTIDG